MNANEVLLTGIKYDRGQNRPNLFQSNFSFFDKYLRDFSSKNNGVVIIGEDSDILTLSLNSQDKNLVLLFKPLNQVAGPDQFLASINERIPTGTVIVASAEISEIIKTKILKRYPYPFNRIIYFLHFLIHRVLPKLSRSSSRIYRIFTKGKPGIQHRSEILGRLGAHGFTVFDYTIQEGRLFFAASKTSSVTKNVNGSTGLIFSMPRVGRSGKEMRFYKLRTMHAYSQYLHEFMMSEHGLDSDGKFKNDFRIASWGKFFRKYWIDEMPMIINLIRGDMKIVGVRPISKKYFDLYPKDVQTLRLKTKPGFIPPSYAFSPASLEEIIELEKRYLLEYFEKPLETDLKYFFKVLRNVFVSKIRSR